MLVFDKELFLHDRHVGTWWDEIDGMECTREGDHITCGDYTVRLNWCREVESRKVNLTTGERKILIGLYELGYLYLARDKDSKGTLYAYTEQPIKGTKVFCLSADSECININRNTMVDIEFDCVKKGECIGINHLLSTDKLVGDFADVL